MTGIFLTPAGLTSSSILCKPLQKGSTLIYSHDPVGGWQKGGQRCEGRIIQNITTFSNLRLFFMRWTGAHVARVCVLRVQKYRQEELWLAAVRRQQREGTVWEGCSSSFSLWILNATPHAKLRKKTFSTSDCILYSSEVVLSKISNYCSDTRLQLMTFIMG